MNVGDKFEFIGYAKPLKGANEVDYKLPSVLVPIAGTSPRVMNVVSPTLIEHNNIPHNVVCKFEATYVGLHKEPEIKEGIEAFSFSLVEILGDTIAEDNDQLIKAKYLKDNPLEYLIYPGQGR